MNSSGSLFSDNFDGANDTTSLKARGYLTYYRGSGPQGTAATWFQGDSTIVVSFNGPSDGYVASNFQSVTLVNNIDNWLVLPELSVDSGTRISFYCRSIVSSTPFPDSVKVMYSSAGDSVPEALTWVTLDDFLVNVNGWEYKSFIIPAASATGRIAIRYAVVDGGPDGTNSNYIGIDQLDVFTPFSSDGSLFSITSPATGCSLSNAEPVTVAAVNNGIDTLMNFSLAFIADGGTPVIEGVSSSIAPGDTLTYTFTATADMSTIGQHSMMAYFSFANDSNAMNDTATAQLSNNIPAPDPDVAPFTMGFEPAEDFTGWKILDANNDGATWIPIDINPHSGTFCMRKIASSVDDNDWLFTKCMEMTAGTNYTLDYWFKEFELTLPCSLETYIGTTQDPAGMTTSLIQHAIPTDTTYQHAILNFTVPNTGIYYIAFHAFIPAGSGSSSLRLDDINLDDGTFIGVEENYLVRHFSVYPNPSNGLFNIHSKSPSSNTTVEVFDLSGRTVYSKMIGAWNDFTIDLKNEPAGIYNVRITNDGYSENCRLINSAK